MMNPSTRTLGHSTLQITRVGIGSVPFGSTPEWHIYWGAQDEGEAIRAIQAALDLGVNWIDSAPFYGWGRAEQIVGKAMKGRRGRVYLFTKCGTLPDGRGGWYDSLKPESIKSEVEASLHNLQTDYLDLLQFHDPDPQTPIDESWSALQQLIAEGKVRCGGNQPALTLRLNHGDWRCVQTPAAAPAYAQDIPVWRSHLQANEQLHDAVQPAPD